MGRVIGFGPSEAARYPDKVFSTARAMAARKAVVMTRVVDERDEEVIVISWGGRSREFRQLEDAERFVETIPYPPGRHGSPG